MRTFELGMAISLSVLLVACNDNNQPSTATTSANANSLQSISVWKKNPADSTLGMTELRSYSYLNNGNVDKVIGYQSAGADGKWATKDDVANYYVTCEYGVAKTLKPIDLIEETNRYFSTDSITGQMLFAILGLTIYQEGYNYQHCINPFHTQQFISQNIFSPGADNILFTPDDIQSSGYLWILTEQASLPSYSETYVFSPSNGLGSFLAPKHYYYAPTSSATKYLVGEDGSYYQYDYTPQGRLQSKTKKVYQGQASAWVGVQTSDHVISQTLYTYLGNDIQQCSPSNKTIETLKNGHLIELKTYEVGADNVSCTADDVLTTKEVYTYN